MFKTEAEQKILDKNSAGKPDSPTRFRELSFLMGINRSSKNPLQTSDSLNFPEAI
jgi:hypothetical protein